MMTTSANHAGTEKRFSEVVWTSIQGVAIIRKETSFWENDTVLSQLEAFLFFFCQPFPSCQLVAHPVGSSALLVKKAHQQKHKEHLSPSAVTSATRSQICKIRKSLPCTLSSLAGGAQPKKSQRDQLRRAPLGKRSVFGLPCC